MANTEKFEQDLDFLVSKLTQGVGKDIEVKLHALKNNLFQLHKENVVKINHSVMEMICAKHLILKGYEVMLECPLNSLTCDIYAVKGYGNLIVEIETGFIPPEHALDPSAYTSARIASKIIRYSSYVGKFALGIPPHYVLSFPEAFRLPPRERKLDDVKAIKSLCDFYYKNPPVSLEEVKNARIHSIYIIDVDQMNTQEVDPEGYINYVKACALAT
jgi:hypothetical protein